MMDRMAGTDLGTRIRLARQRRGWSQADLADALTVQRGGRRVGARSVGRWERGESESRMTGALEAVLGISLSVEADPVRDRLEQNLNEMLAIAVSLEQPSLMTPGRAEAMLREYDENKRSNGRHARQLAG